jgi:hypothetical protein
MNKLSHMCCCLATKKERHKLKSEYLTNLIEFHYDCHVSEYIVGVEQLEHVELIELVI